jgi:hypothetical protein
MMSARRAVSVLVVVGTAVIAAPVVASRNSGSDVPKPRHLAATALTRDFAVRRTLRVSHRPGRAVVGAGAVWIITDHGVAPVGIRSRQVAGPQVVLERRPTDIAFGYHRLWVVDAARGEVLGVDPRTASVAIRASAPGARRVAVGEGAIWAATAKGRLFRISSGGTVTDGPSGLPNEQSVSGLAAGLGAIWVDEGGVVYALEPRRGGALEQRVDLHSDAGVLAIGFGAVWVATTTEGDAVTRIDPRNGLTRRIHVQASAYPDGVGISGDSVWVASSNRGTLYRVNPQRLQRVGAALTIGDLSDGLAIVHGSVWLSHRHDDTLSIVRRTAARRVRPLRGGRIDEVAGSYRSVGIGDRVEHVRHALGPGGHWGPREAIVPLDADFLRLGNGADFTLDTLRIVPADGRALRYRDVFFYPCGRRLHCADRVGGFEVTGYRARTARGVHIGDRLALARRRYHVHCATGNLGAHPSSFPFCTGRVANRRYIFFDNDPIDDIAVSAAPWG